MNKALVSICVPTYNGEAYLAQALDSAIAQTYPNLEIVVSDDASSDGTLEIVKQYKNKTSIPIYIHHHSPSGIGANWNHCIEQANGEFIKFLFQDDIIEPRCIAEMANTFNEYPEVALVASKRGFIIEGDAQNSDLQKWLSKYANLQAQFADFQDELYLDKTLFKRADFLQSPLNKIGEPSIVMFKKNLTLTVGWFRTDLRQVLDYEYWYRIIKDHPAIVLNKSLAKFRVHANQETQKNKNRIIDDYTIYFNLLKEDYGKLLHPKTLKRLTPKKRYKGYYFIKRCKKQLKRIFN